MVKKITGDKKDLKGKRLKLKGLHRDVREEKAELSRLSPDELPPASNSNAARQVRSQLNNTFPVDWHELHKERSKQEDESD